MIVVQFKMNCHWGGKHYLLLISRMSQQEKHVPIETRAAPSSPNNLYLLDVAGGRRVSLTLLFHSAITSGGVLGAYAIATEMVQEDPEK